MNATPETNRNVLDKDTRSSSIARTGDIAFALRWKEARWQAGKGHVGGPITPLHAADLDDGSRIPCYGVNSLYPTSTDYLHLVEMLGPEQPFFSIHPPSQERNAERARSVTDLAKYYVDALVKFQPAGPLALAGWSVGAVIALEMAHQLKEVHNREVALLIAIDFAPLNTSADKRPLSIFEKMARLYYQNANFARWAYEEVNRNPSLPSAAKAIWNKADESITRRRARRREAAGLFQRHPVEDRLSFYNHIPRDAQEYAKALHDAVEEYVPKKYSGPVLVYVSTAQPLRLESRVEEKWKDIADSVSFFILEGTHVSIFEQRHGRPLAEHLKGKLDELSSAMSGAANYPVSNGTKPLEVGLK
jgi:thioesterase domain-containing protein